jgi:hypothetical protein
MRRKEVIMSQYTIAEQALILSLLQIFPNKTYAEVEELLNHRLKLVYQDCIDKLNGKE